MSDSSVFKVRLKVLRSSTDAIMLSKMTRYLCRWDWRLLQGDFDQGAWVNCEVQGARVEQREGARCRIIRSAEIWWDAMMSSIGQSCAWTLFLERGRLSRNFFSCIVNGGAVLFGAYRLCLRRVCLVVMARVEQRAGRPRWVEWEEL